MKNLLKEKILRGERPIGTFLDLGSAAVAEALGIAGLDFFIIDTEHSQYDLPEISSCCIAAERRGITPLVRIKEISRSSIMKALDVGAMGLIVPGIRTLEEAESAVSYAKYIPEGNRGFCPTRCCEWGYSDAMKDGIRAYTDMCNRETMLILQCETVECLGILEEIVALPGVDGIFIGPFDLSVSFQKPGKFDDPEIKSAFARILKVTKAAGKPVFNFVTSTARARGSFEEGYDCICFNADLNVMVDGFKAVIKEIKA